MAVKAVTKGCAENITIYGEPEMLLPRSFSTK
jgi:hypothetical protein